MFLRSAFRQPPSCSIHSLGLSISQTTTRTFSSSQPSLLRRLPHVAPVRSRVASLQSSRRPIFLTTVAASALSVPLLYSGTTTYNDASPAADFSTSAYSHGRDAKVPISKDGGRSLNPQAIKQISMGSIVGLGLGVVVSAFSKMLVLVLGLAVVGWQFAARRGYNFIPVDRLQSRFKGINLRAAINDNAAFKISFGLMFALTAFGDF